MGRLPALRPEVLITVLLVLAVGSAAAQDRHVTRLRMDKVTLFSCASEEQEDINGTFAPKNMEIARTESSPLWPILAGPSKAGRLVVKVGEALYCVRAYAVETNATINAGADCGTMVAAAQPRSGATRGLGNDGKGNNHCRQQK
jgi:hypothetical protein